MLDQPFHSPTRPWVSNPTPQPGETVTITLVVPDPSSFHTVQLRSVRDGEGDWVMGVSEPTSIGHARWTFQFTCHNPVAHYRFRLLGSGSPKWLTGIGIVDYDIGDNYDFRLLTTGAGPEWVGRIVWYQIFPDRFASTGAYNKELPAWAHPARWSDPIEEYPESMTQMFGGDLDGVTEHLDYIAGLGVGGIYLNPIFPAESNHRYNASTFDHVDPLLGGDDALRRLIAACHARGLRVVLDLTLNHTGDTHEWFRAALNDPAAPEVGYYYFIDYPDDYASWLGTKSLPKLNHDNDEMAEKFYRGPDSIVARYLQEPFGIDGWRIDVANMTGRYNMIDINFKVRNAVRKTVEAEGADRWLLGEHFFDASRDLVGDGWHGVMNYKGVARPIWSWLAADAFLVDLMAGPGIDARDGIGVARSIDEVMAAIPYQVALSSMALVGSHDTPRVASYLRSPDLLVVAETMLFTLPGSPCFLYGDERGVTGNTDEQSRAPMPWDTEPDAATLAMFKDLIALRSNSEALAIGGFRWVERSADALAYLRESPTERLLIRVTRADSDPLVVDAGLLGTSQLEPIFGTGTVTGSPDEVAPGRPGLTIDADGASATIWRLGA